MFACMEAGTAAAAVGFLLGSMPDRDNRMTENNCDFPGAVLWSFAAAAVATGLTYCFTVGQTFEGWAAVAFGLALSLARIFATWTPRARIYLDDGINHMPGKTEKDKLRAAVRAYNSASFCRKNSDYHATRSTSSTANAACLRLNSGS